MNARRPVRTDSSARPLPADVSKVVGSRSKREGRIIGRSVGLGMREAANFAPRPKPARNESGPEGRGRRTKATKKKKRAAVSARLPTGIVELDTAARFSRLAEVGRQIQD